MVTREQAKADLVKGIVFMIRCLRYDEQSAAEFMDDVMTEVGEQVYPEVLKAVNKS
jgi:DNA-binding phage protein